jgi:hypothetical protein
MEDRALGPFLTRLRQAVPVGRIEVRAYAPDGAGDLGWGATDIHAG